MTRFMTFLIFVLAVIRPVAAAEPVTVFAAASLQGALDQITTPFDADVQVSYGGSGTMARQVGAGAPADVVVLANALWMDWLQDQQIAGLSPSRMIARNRLVLIAPKGAAPLTSPDDIPMRLRDGRLAMGQRAAVPAGTYARQWFKNAGIWDQVIPHLAETENVRAALALVARGDVDLGVVYATDAAAEPDVDVIWQIQTQDHDPITYLAAALSPAGATFLDHLTSPVAADVFSAHDFLPVAP